MLTEVAMTLPVLFIVGIAAGFVDAIAGGGGLLALPALLSTGITPVEALATNKLQATFGTLTATANYIRNGIVPLHELRYAVIFSFLGSAIGAMLIQLLPNHLLADVIAILLICFAVYFLFPRKFVKQPRQQRMSALLFGLLIGTSVGFYDGFFGPGTGSLFMFAFVSLLGYSLQHAVGGTKLLNFTSNLAALLVFLFSGQIVWLMGLVMAAGQVVGSYLGSHVTLIHGARIIRPLLVIISISIAVKLLLD